MGKIEKMVQYVKDTCADDSVGYAQVRRWRNPDVDCSSFMYLAANAAGYNVPTGYGYTGTMLADFKKAGFTAVKFDGNLNDLDAGDILLKVENHNEMYIGNGKFGGAHIDENGGIAGASGGDQTGNEVSIVNAYVYSGGWDYVLIPPKESGSNGSSGSTDLDTVARQVISGDWGNGSDRKSRLESAGYDYNAVQARVNAILNGSASSGSSGKSIDQLAKEVINGDWGNGTTRKNALEGAGYDYDAVQKRVNEMMG